MKPENRVVLPMTEENLLTPGVIEAAGKVGPAAVEGSLRPGPADRSGVSYSEFGARTIALDFAGGLAPTHVDRLLAERVPATTIRPNLVLPGDVSAPECYKRLQGQEQKGQYREKLRESLFSVWQREYGDERGAEILDRFNQLSSLLQEEGAVVLGDLIDRKRFARLVEAYDELMQKDGSVSLLHSYANLRNQPDFLANPDFNGAFFHPLAVALISERVGGAIRVVDARAKDAGPISVRAQDNMLHIDNTPYRDEYKILVTWEKGRASGPKGQNFVYLPGTHKGVRDSLVDPDTGEVYSTENASIFIRPTDVDQVFALQEQVRPDGRAVVEIQDKDRPTTTVFPSGSIVHHRLRTEEGQ